MRDVTRIKEGTRCPWRCMRMDDCKKRNDLSFDCILIKQNPEKYEEYATDEIRIHYFRIRPESKSDRGRDRCIAITADGKQCNKNVRDGKKYCYIHKDMQDSLE